MIEITVRTKIIFTKDNPYGMENIEIPASYNMTKAALFNRNPEFEIRLISGMRFICKKEFIAGIEELPVIVREEKKEEEK
jgi:hypothetical protein